MPEANAFAGVDAEVSEVEEVQQPAEQSESAEESGTSENSEQEQNQDRDDKGQFKPKFSKDVQKRIDKLTAQRREAERRAAELERKLAERETQATKPAEQKTSDKPTPDKFGTYEEYVEALTDWKTEQKLAREREQRKAETEKAVEAERQKTLGHSWQESEAKARKEHADYDEVIQEAAEAIRDGELPKISDSTFRAIMETDSKAEILYHLAKNREDLEQLASATGSRVYLELGKIEAKLNTPAQEKPKVTGAPKPPSTVGGRANKSFDPNDPSVDINEWMKRERERTAKRQR